jgi:hypothetical protein
MASSSHTSSPKPNIQVVPMAPLVQSTLLHPGPKPFINKPPSKAKRVTPRKSSINQFTRNGLKTLVDANGHQHLVYTIYSFFSPPLTRVCFVDAPDWHTTIDPAILLPAPPDLDISAVDRSGADLHAHLLALLSNNNERQASCVGAALS